jgi:hypothetical protein
MATASKRLSRKEIRQPDWFQVNSEKALEFFQSHKGLGIGVLAALLLFFILFWVWQGFKTSQNNAAAEEFTKATELYHQENYRAAIAAFEKVQTYRWSRYASVAHLYQTNSHLALGEVDKAIGAGQRAVSATKPNTLYRQLALMALANGEEQKNQCKSAVERFNEAQKIVGPLQSEALLGKARCMELLGDLAGAVSAYKEYLKDNPGAPARSKLAEIEAKIPVKAQSK